jgi:hypothetical protein
MGQQRSEGTVQNMPTHSSLLIREIVDGIDPPKLGLESISNVLHTSYK